MISVSIIVGALTEMCIQSGTVNALKATQQRLNLAKLDSNHDIARAARRAQLRASLHLLENTQDALVHLPQNAPSNFTAKDRYSIARNHLLNEISRCGRENWEDVAKSLPQSRYEQASQALTELLSAENFKTDHAALTQDYTHQALNEVVAAGAWSSPPESLSAAFTNKKTGFAALFMNFLAVEIKTNDPFFRIFIALRQEQTLAAIDTLTIAITKYQSERTGIASQFISGERPLAYYQDIAQQISDMHRDLTEVVQTTNRIEDQTKTISALLRHEKVDSPALKLLASFKKRVAFAAGTLVTILVAASLFYWNGAQRTKTYWCTNFSEIWGAPECIKRIPDSEIISQAEVYRFTQKGKLIKRVDLMSAYNTPRETLEPDYSLQPWHHNVSSWEYYYDDNGNISKTHMRDVHGNIIRRLTYNFDKTDYSGVVRFDRLLGQAERQDSTATLLGAQENDNDVFKSTISQHRLKFDRHGRIIERVFESAGGGTAKDTGGSYGRRYEHDMQGLIRSIRNLDSRGGVITGKTGVAILWFSYDENGRIERASWRDISENLTLTQSNIAEVVWHRDDWGRIIKTQHLDANGNITYKRETGVAQRTASYDAKGNFIERRHHDLEGNLISNIDGGFAIVRFSYNEKGQYITDQYFDIDDQPIILKEYGYATSERDYSDNGYVSQMRFYGIDNQPILRAEHGYFQQNMTYDARGNMLSQSYFGPDGKPIIRSDIGIAKVEWTYTPSGLLEAIYFKNTNGNLTPHNQYGAAMIKYDYDAFGNNTSWAFYGANQEPVLESQSGIFRTVRKFDAAGNATDIYYYGLDNKLKKERNSGVAHINIVYDPYGNEVEYRNYDANEKLTLSLRMNAAIIKTQHDSRGFRILEESFGKDEKPILSISSNAAKVEFKNNIRGMAVETRYYDISGSPLTPEDGIFLIVREFNDAGHRTVEKYFDHHENPMQPRKSDIAEIRWGYDSRNYNTSVSFYDKNGALARHLREGYAKRTDTFDERGNRIAIDYYGSDGKPILAGIKNIAGYRWSINNLNLVEEERFVGLDGQPILSSDWGYAASKITYDEKAYAIQQDFFGIDGKPVLVDRGYASVIAERDAIGRAIAEKYFDLQGNPVKRTPVFAEDEQMGDLFGPWRNYVFYGVFTQEKFEPLDRSGFAIIRQDLNATGDVIARQYYDEKGDPTPGFYGFTEEFVEYNVYGKPVLFRPVVPELEKQIYTRIIYSETGTVSRIEYLSPDGKIVDGALGYARIFFTENRDNEAVFDRTENAAGKVIQKASSD